MIVVHRARVSKSRKVLQFDQDCIFCPMLTRRKPGSEELVDHQKAGFKCKDCGRHVHTEGKKPGCCAAVEHN